MFVISALSRRASLHINCLGTSPLRLLRNRPVAQTFAIPDLDEYDRPEYSPLRRKKIDDGNESRRTRLIKGEIVVEKFEKYENKKKKPVAPKIINLVDEPRSPELNKPEKYTRDQKIEFSGIKEIVKDDVLGDYQKNEIFGAEFLDTVGPGVKPSYNVAALAEKVEVFQKLTHLGVSMYKWDKKPDLTEKLLPLDWTKDVEPRIHFLVKVAGLRPDELSLVLSRNPRLLIEETQHLQARIAFLYDDSSQGLALKKSDVNRIIVKQPYWLSFSIERLENRFEFFMSEFEITHDELKFMIVRCPKIVVSNLRSIADTKFAMLEQMGFSPTEIKQMLVNSPRVFLRNKEELVRRFEFLHNVIGYEHHIISTFPQVFNSREKRIEERLGFLRHNDRAQFNPKMPGYVNPEELTKTNDDEFVEQIAKSTMDQFEAYLKTF